MSLADYEDEAIEVWPDIWPAFNVFNAMSTQWRSGMNGPTGLDYGCLPQVMDWLELDERERATVFKDIRLMEGVALSVIHKRNG